MKSLTSYHPVESVRTLVDIDRLIDSFFGNSVPLGSTLSWPHSKYPAVDIRELNDSYLIEAALPGCNEKCVEVNLDGSTLTIESKKDADVEDAEAKKNYIIRERYTEYFSRSFKLPENADTAQVDANFTNGLLSLTVKKRSETQKRVIDINSKR